MKKKWWAKLLQIEAREFREDKNNNVTNLFDQRQSYLDERAVQMDQHARNPSFQAPNPWGLHVARSVLQSPHWSKRWYVPAANPSLHGMFLFNCGREREDEYEKEWDYFHCVLNFQCWAVDVLVISYSGDAMRMKLWEKKELTCWINTMFIGHDLENERIKRDWTNEMRERTFERQTRSDDGPSSLKIHRSREFSQLTSQNFAPIWLPHCPPWMWTISLIVAEFTESLKCYWRLLWGRSMDFNSAERMSLFSSLLFVFDFVDVKKMARIFLNFPP